MKPSIKIKTTALVAISIIGTMALLWIGCLFLAEPVMLETQERHIYTLYESIAAYYSDDPDDLGRLVGDYEEGNYLRVEIYGKDGELIYTTGRKMSEGFSTKIPFGEEKDSLFEEPHQTMRPEGYQRDPRVQRLKIADRETLVINGIIELENGEERYVSIETPVAAISGMVSVMNLLILGVAVVVIGVGCVAAYIYAKRFSRPIIAVSETAKRVAALDFSHHADEEISTAELADLAVSINAMSGQLEAFIGELMEKNRRLAEDNERLEREEEMRRCFVANVSHDLKSPLAVLGGYAEMMKEQTAGIDHAACCDVIIDETARMNEMISSMLEVSALENGLKKLQTSEVDLSGMTLDLLGIERPLLERNHQILQAYIDPEIAVEGDEAYLMRAVRNVLENACAHTPKGGVIAVTVTEEGQNAVLSVYNDGENIPLEKMGHIWESFYRTDEARTRDEHQNVGLGLYIVHTVILAHGGTCEAVNEPQGVRFNLKLKRLKNCE